MSVHSGVGSSSGPDFGDRLGDLRLRIASRLRLGLVSRSMRYGLRRDLERQVEARKAKIPIAVRELTAADVPALLPFDGGLDAAEALEIARRRAFVVRGIERGFVAIDETTGQPCYVQWLIGPADAARLDGFPSLGADEALLENAYTPPAYRGMGIMAEAMALIAERGADVGARYILTFVEADNIGSLKGCQRSGFDLHLLHHRLRLGFGLVRRDGFEVLAEDDPRRETRF